MATKLPSFLHRSTAATPAQPTRQTENPATPGPIFRSKPPVLLTEAAQKLNEKLDAQSKRRSQTQSDPQMSAKAIFRTAPPVLMNRPAAPDRAAAAPAASASQLDNETEDRHKADALPHPPAPSPGPGSRGRGAAAPDTRPGARPATPVQRLAATLAAPIRLPPSAPPQPADQASPPPPDLADADPGNDFRIVALPRLAQGGRWRTEAMRSYSAPVLIWFTRGQGRITISGSTRGFGAHNAVYLPPGTMHGFEMTGQVFGSQITFPRDATLMLPDRPHHLRFREAADQNELSQMIDHLQREIERDLPVARRALGHHAGLLSVWLERQILKLDPGEVGEPAARRLAAAYTALVEQDLSAARSVSDFAAKLGVTPTHLTRSCKAACGRSAHEILSDRLFFEARRLLRDTSWPVRKIADALGFTSPAYFTRAFQKATHETPTGFRRRR